MKVSKIKTDEEMELIKNKEVTTKMINKIINDDAEIYTETGELLFKFKKNVLTGGKDFYKNVKPFMDKHPSSNRGSVSGGIKKNIKDNPIIKTSILGYFDRWAPKQKVLFKKAGIKTPLEVRETLFNMIEPEKYKLVIPYIKQVDNLYKKYIPDKYKKQRKKADETEFKIEGTSFTTVTTNINFQTTIHKDKGDDEDGFGNISVVENGSYDGGETCFPQYGIGVNVREGDLLLMNVHEWHGNLPIKLKGKNVERLSIVCYLRRNIWLRTKNKTKKFRDKHNKTLRNLREHKSV